MNAVEKYFSSYNDSLPVFPSTRLENYRYSRILECFSNLEIKNTNRMCDNESIGDYCFCNDNIPDHFSRVSVKELSPVYQRYSDFFKTAALLRHSEFIVIPIEKEEIDLVFFITQNSLMSLPIYLEITEARAVRINVHFVTEDDSIAMPIFFIHTHVQASVQIIYSVDDKKNKGILCPTFECLAEESSRISFQYFGSHSSIQRLSFLGYCMGVESHIDIRHATFLTQDVHQDLFVRIFHESQASTSNQMINTVVLDNAQMNFNGQIYASKEAKNVFAYQMLKGINYGANARIFARPQLDIEYYELACSHGVSIGGFDPEHLFYLKTRGIAESEVYTMLLRGFLSDTFTDTQQSLMWFNKIDTILQMAHGFGQSRV